MTSIAHSCPTEVPAPDAGCKHVELVVNEQLDCANRSGAKNASDSELTEPLGRSSSPMPEKYAMKSCPNPWEGVGGGTGVGSAGVGGAVGGGAGVGAPQTQSVSGQKGGFALQFFWHHPSVTVGTIA